MAEEQRVVRLFPGQEARILSGHPWVFANQLALEPPDLAPGERVTVLDAGGRFIGRGYANPHSLIRVRLLTRDPGEPVDDALIRRRITRAWEHRQKILADPTVCRVVFAEADELPGLIVDRFGDAVVTQFLTAGIECFREVVTHHLQTLLSPAGIYDRSDEPVRDREGLPRRRGFLAGSFPIPHFFTEHGLTFCLDVERGQKTGHFLDQRENRRALRAYCTGARVLDAFCNTGGFALNALAGGAREVVAVDSSAAALELLAANCRANGLAASIRAVQANAFDFLREQQRAGECYDVIVLDPPAFARSRRQLEGALRGYKEINLRALRMLSPGGILFTCSCSSPVSPELFLQVVHEAATDARRRLRLLEERGQPPDHPILLGYDESRYLKCLVLQVL